MGIREAFNTRVTKVDMAVWGTISAAMLGGAIVTGNPVLVLAAMMAVTGPVIAKSGPRGGSNDQVGMSLCVGSLALASGAFGIDAAQAATTMGQVFSAAFSLGYAALGAVAVGGSWRRFRAGVSAPH